MAEDDFFSGSDTESVSEEIAPFGSFEQSSTSSNSGGRKRTNPTWDYFKLEKVENTRTLTCRIRECGKKLKVRYHFFILTYHSY